MRHQEFDPPPELRHAIRCFWHNQRDFGAEGESFEVIPDGYVEIIFHFGGLRGVLRAGAVYALPSPFMMGLLNQPAVFRANNRLDIIAIRCFPWTVFDLLGLPPDREGSPIVTHPLARLQGPLGRAVHSGRIEQAIALVRDYFLAAPSAALGDGTLAKAGRAMTEANGTLAVKQVAAAAHSTVRTLERKFKRSSGHTVRDVSGLMRFEQVRNALWQQPESDLAGLAQALGYADQSHLTRDFKRYTRTTPAAFARQAKARKQAENGDFVAFVQA